MTEDKRRRLPNPVALAALALLAGMMASFWAAGGRDALDGPFGAVDRSIGSLVRNTEPHAMSDIVFTEAGGQTRRLSEWRGQTVILNLWAAWCAPCKAEMPSLDRLEAQLGDDGFAVIAVSVDKTGFKEPAAFFAREGISRLKLFNDSTGEASLRLGAPGLPYTAVLNGKGQQVARVTGPAEWDSPAMIAQLRSLR